jgi:hypothetical protein
MGLAKAGKLDEAARELADLVAVDVESPTLPFLLGAVRAKQQDLGAAIASYSEAIARAERIGFAAMIPKAALCRAHALLALDRIDEARTDLESAAAAKEDAVAREAKVALSRLP